MKLLMLCCVLLILFCLEYSECKRGGGSRGGGSKSKSSGGSSWWWSGSSSKKSSSSSSQAASAGGASNAPAPKASVPHETKKQTSHVQQQPASNPNYNNNQKTPIGWNVPGNKQGSASPGSSWWWNRKNKSSSPSSYNKSPSWTTLQEARYKQRNQEFQAPQPSAPRFESSIKKPSFWATNTGTKKQNTHLQKSPNPKQMYNNWNTPNTRQNSNSKQSTNHQSHSYPTGNQPHGSLSNTGHHPQQQGAWGSQQHGGWGNQQQGSWGGQQQQHGGWGGGYSNQHGYSGGGYGGYGGGHNSYGGMQRGGYMGGYGGGMGGYGGGMGGYGGGMGGYGGGMGGYGGGMGMGMAGMGGYGMQRKSGFFSGGSTFGNILTGMAIYHVTSSLVKGIFGGGQKRPYNVYNYYNQPAEAREEIKLPSNVLSMCEGNLTTVCTGATAICTTNNTVLCVVTISQATPCADEKAMCINTTIPCTDNSDPLCQNNTQQQTETTVNVPCYTNLSVDINLLNEPGAAKTDGDDYKYCVTTMAVAGPDYSRCSAESLLEKYDYRNILSGNYTWNLTFTPMMRKYQSYNYKNPTQTSTGDLVLPLTALIPCIENATKVCAPDLVTICTGFGEIMCIKPLKATTYCEEYNTTCQKSLIACQENIELDFLCQNKTEEELVIQDEKKFINVEMPCFANITLDTNLPNFDITTFNGTIPGTAPSSFMYHYHLCLITLSVPGPETDMCLINDGSEVKS